MHCVRGIFALIFFFIALAGFFLASFIFLYMQVSLPSYSLGLPAYYILASSESSSNLSRYDGVRLHSDLVL